MSSLFSLTYSISADKILLTSLSPLNPPQQDGAVLGEYSHPGGLILVMEKVCQLRRCNFSELASQVYSTFKSFYGIGT